MRISDWSSDVCSSDLWSRAGCRRCYRSPNARTQVRLGELRDVPRYRPRHMGEGQGGCPTSGRVLQDQRGRSEEHTSELQSLMRISYAVFCLKKKTKDNNRIHHTTYIQSGHTRLI